VAPRRVECRADPGDLHDRAHYFVDVIATGLLFGLSVLAYRASSNLLTAVRKRQYELDDRTIGTRVGLTIVTYKRPRLAFRMSRIALRITTSHTVSYTESTDFDVSLRDSLAACLFLHFSRNKL
jgi:hypothetical protein